jgi:hypothetical protein
MRGGIVLQGDKQQAGETGLGDRHLSRLGSIHWKPSFQAARWCADRGSSQAKNPYAAQLERGHGYPASSFQRSDPISAAAKFLTSPVNSRPFFPPYGNVHHVQVDN